MISSTVATLEWAAQVSAAPSRMHITGSPVMAPSKACTPGAPSAGANVSSRMCSASSTSPRPMHTRPRSLTRVRRPLRNATRPTTNKAGAAAVTLKERSWTISVVPTFAPSRMASAGTSPTRPCAVNEAVMSAVAVLLCNRVVRPSPAANAATRLPNAFDRRWRRLEPNARRMPLRTMCRPHSSNATPPIRSRRIIVPIMPHLRHPAPRPVFSTLQASVLLRKKRSSAASTCGGHPQGGARNASAGDEP